jgi:hypothetical protein
MLIPDLDSHFMASSVALPYPVRFDFGGRERSRAFGAGEAVVLKAVLIENDVDPIMHVEIVARQRHVPLLLLKSCMLR